VQRWPYGRFGIVLATEEHSSAELVGIAEKAEAVGLGFAFVSDHFHPWNSAQGHSSNLWPLLGALAAKTDSLGLVSAVTCPIFRVHPTTLAQQAATVHHLSKGRFVLGLGTGEFLNEGIVGLGWPPFGERLGRLRESVALTRMLLRGSEVTEKGKYFQVERARLYDAAPELPIYYAASGPRTAQAAVEDADGLICLGARPELRVERTFPRIAQLSVCWAEDHQSAVATAHRYFPEVALPGTLFCQLQTPAGFEQAALQVQPRDVAAAIACGPDPEPYLQEIEACFEAGFEAVALHQIGPDQDGFLRFWERTIGRSGS